MAGDEFSELFPLQRVRDAGIQSGLSDTKRQGRDETARALKTFHRFAQASAESADDVLLRDDHVIEDELAHGPSVQAELGYFFCFETMLVPIDQEHRILLLVCARDALRAWLKEG